MCAACRFSWRQPVIFAMSARLLGPPRDGRLKANGTPNEPRSLTEGSLRCAGAPSRADPERDRTLPPFMCARPPAVHLTGTAREHKPWLNGLPRIIFVNDMGDTFTASLPEDWLAPELGIMAASPHQWILLTKRADRRRDFSFRHTLSPNVWAGVSITSPQDQRLRYLMQTRARIRWVSYEPILAPVDWRPWPRRRPRVDDLCVRRGDQPVRGR